ncbi:hypothetical protein [Brachyspira pilosicoli]|uniref:hypothetical protein n=1 Tax=Brachyspira pilosicoli TaxID=52584 RepID=UPI00266691AA|nr:hypothetical protein [Brachyspira pilosicoli]
MIVKEKGIKNYIKKIFKKNTDCFDSEIYSNNNTRKKIYEYIYKVSKGDSKSISLRYELLYTEYSRIKKINLQKLAKNRNIKTIEMALELDKNNNTKHIDNLYKLAKELFVEVKENE